MKNSTSQLERSRKQKSLKRERRLRRRLESARRSDESGRDNGPKMERMELDVSDRIRAHGMGGLGLVHQMVKRLGLDKEINARLSLLKIRQGYSEADHVFALAYNTLAGGRCLGDLERLRSDEALLDNLKAKSLPDPTTAGDFCRRFTCAEHVDALSDAINAVRERIWAQQREDFLEEAHIDGDGTIVGTLGECKSGISLSYKGIWGYQPLLISLANTAEPLFIVNRTGGASSADGAAAYYDKAFAMCRRVGFKKISARGDTAFSQTEHLDRWANDGVTFTFGYSIVPGIRSRIEALDESAWSPLSRQDRTAEGESDFTVRTRPENVRQRIVTERGYKDLRVVAEHIAEFEHQPSRASRSYRMVVLRKEIEAYQGEKRLFAEYRYFAYITNDTSRTTQDVVFFANKRADQEKLIGTLKSEVRSLRAPVDGLVSNWAYMVMTTLAWSLKAWSALLLPRGGRWAAKYEEQRTRLLTMGFRGFVEAMIRVPVQVIVAARQIKVRLLAWNAYQQVFLRLASAVERPLLC